jgi:hypothetical protein
MKSKTKQRPSARKEKCSNAASSTTLPSSSANITDSHDDEIFAEPPSFSVNSTKSSRVPSVRPELAAQALLVPRGSRHDMMTLIANLIYYRNSYNFE